MYNPMVSDVSGQLMAQGINQGANSFMQGLQEYQRKQDEDKDLLARARATKSFIKTHADLFGGEDAVAQLTAENPNVSPREKYLLQAEMVQNTLTGEKIKADQQMMATHKAQMDEANARLAAFNLDQQQQAATRARLQNLSQFQQGTGTGVYSPQAQASMNQQIYGQPAAPMGTPAGGPVQVPNGAAPQVSGIAPSTLAQFSQGLNVPTQPYGQLAPPRDQTFGERAVEDFRMTGRVPTPAEVDALRRTMSQETIAGQRFGRSAPPPEERTTSDGSRYLWNSKTGQYQFVPTDKADKIPPQFAGIDAMETNGDLSHAEAVQQKKDILAGKVGAGPKFEDYMMWKMTQNDPDFQKFWADRNKKPDSGTAPAGDGPTYNPDQAKAAKPGPFVGSNGQKYIKNADGTISRR